jgi:hypothetical protein
MDSVEVVVESAVVSSLNIVAVYLAAFTYRLNWSGVMMVMIIASLLTASLSKMIVMKFMANKERPGVLMKEAIGALVVALLAALAVFVILIDRFDLPSALGISLLSGMLTTLVRRVLG